MGEVSTTVRIDDPDVQKQVKVQKRGSIHLAKDLAGERVEVIATAFPPRRHAQRLLSPRDDPKDILVD